MSINLVDSLGGLRGSKCPASINLYEGEGETICFTVQARGQIGLVATVEVGRVELREIRDDIDRYLRNWGELE